MSDEKEYDLKVSVEKLGKLIPVIEDAHGNIIDGIHRLEIDPNWPRIRLEHVTDPVQLEMARAAMNECRRVVDAEERGKRYGKIIELTGWTPSQLAENIGIPYRTIIRYLPPEFKKPEPEQLASAKVALSKESEETRQFLPHPLECASCHTTTRLRARQDEFVQIGDKTYCRDCAKNVKPKPKPTVKKYKPKDTWEHRKAQMSPKVSHMEERIKKKLTEAGIPFESQVEYCIKKCIPDFVVKGIPFFIDGEAVHAKREEKDTEARSRLAQFYNVEPVGLPYKADTETEAQRLFSQILEEALS